MVHEYRANGLFTRTLLGVVAVDDARGLIIFSIMLAAAQALSGQGEGVEVLAEVGAEEVFRRVLQASREPLLLAALPLRED